MKSRWLNIAIWVGLGILWVGLIVILDIRAHEDFGWKSTISWGMAQLGTSHPLVAFLIGGLVFGSVVGLAVHWWGGATLPNPVIQAEIDRLSADVAALAAERDRWKADACTYYPPDGVRPAGPAGHRRPRPDGRGRAAAGGGGCGCGPAEGSYCRAGGGGRAGAAQDIPGRPGPEPNGGIAPCRSSARKS